MLNICYMLYVKKEILVKGELYRLDVWSGVNAGIAKNVGDVLTFVILSQEGTCIQRSVIRSVTGKPPAGFPNMSVTQNDNPDTAALLKLTMTPAAIQVGARNVGLMTDPQNFWRYWPQKIQIWKIQKIQIWFWTPLTTVTLIETKHRPPVSNFWDPKPNKQPQPYPTSVNQAKTTPTNDLSNLQFLSNSLANPLKSTENSIKKRT